MNGEMIVEALSYIDDRYIAECSNISPLFFRRKVLIGLIAAAVCASLVFSVAVVFWVSKDSIVYPPYTEDIHINIYKEISWKESSIQMSRTGFISPVNDSIKMKDITREDLRHLFKCESFDLLCDAVYSKFEVALTENEEIHTVRLMWQFEDGMVNVIIDPKKVPQFITGEFETVGDYGICAVLTDVQSIIEYDVVLKSGEMGIWVFASEECKDELDYVINYIVNSKVSIENFKTTVFE